ncbi:MAG TPA: PIN domain-containing protein [Ideonella sp.]|nr:PIN domain-containing protein [Ideonella sp.]
MSKAIVLDANILIRAVLGKRVRELLVEHAGSVKFVAPDSAYQEARKHLPSVLAKRNADATLAMELLDLLESIVQPVELELYAGMQQQALQRIALRDADDWPVLACAMVMGCPIWTEDADFFGTGVATWTSDRIALYLAA